ncbi:nucleotidyltransferase family protein [Crenobacter sp. SG2305]|uniref:nucleotidyltransferase family protein n=1 Tax=Crenobacter oryzisoli TaxID=3056844 RepID=UPI0025AA8601|nr:nucleotidyltransferase family protein [Crenobacter sp. SG2305]MDN0085433.1 nucleotidyltransferase family protein [Crenobacter sp. SG2305]
MSALTGPCGLLLAAGQARRFGADKRFALIDGEPLLLIAARHLRAVLPDTLVVLREGDDALAELLTAEGIASTRCPQAALGMGHSLAHGVRQRPDADGWLIALADMPHLAESTLTRLAETLRHDVIIAPSLNGVRGHPVGFGRDYYEELIALSGDIGAKPLLQRHAARVTLLPVDDAGVLEDIDTPADLQVLAATRFG